MDKRRREPSEQIDELAHRTIGAAIEVHKTLGPGYLEGVYEEALVVELERRQISTRRQHGFAINYKRHEVGQGRLDLLVADQLIVELKAVESLLPIHQAQLISYLKALDKPLGLLINFNVEVLKHGIKRVILSRP